ncbi:hypothetical protein KGY79_10330 [Candidatus Bipolaricaulota bacterium]|nr:hypothetical protein [Candidatus Bipolaricaulota bacterium]
MLKKFVRGKLAPYFVIVFLSLVFLSSTALLAYSNSSTYQTDRLLVFETGGDLSSRNLRENLKSWVIGEVLQKLAPSPISALHPASVAATAVSILNKYYNYEYVFPKAIDLYTIAPKNEGVYAHYPKGFFKMRGFIGSWRVNDPFYYVILASPEAAGRRITLSFEKQVAFGENDTINRTIIYPPQGISDSKLSYLVVKSPVNVYEAGVYDIEACYGGKCEGGSVEFLN